jgi:hypothetical protein
MRIRNLKRARLCGHNIEILVILSCAAIVLGVGLPMAVSLKQKGFHTAGALFVGLLFGFLLVVAFGLVLGAIFKYQENRLLRLQIGDRVRVGSGNHEGRIGIVQEVAKEWQTARVALETIGQPEIVEFNRRILIKLLYD